MDNMSRPKYIELLKTMAEANRFLARAEEMRELWENSTNHIWSDSKNAACERASLDLTKQLARFRKTQIQ